MVKEAIVLDEGDNVATVLEEINESEMIALLSASREKIKEIQAKDSIPAGHKISISSIGKGEPVKKIGAVMGLASAQIEEGDYVHIHNVESTIKSER